MKVSKLRLFSRWQLLLTRRQDSVQLVLTPVPTGAARTCAI